MKKTILVIDDDINQRQLIKNYLTRNNYDVVCCIDGQEGLNYINENYEKIDFIIMDYIMPNIDGITVLKLLKNNIKTQQIPIIMMSADDIDHLSIIKKCIFLKKPFKQKDLEYLVSLVQNTYTLNYLI